MLNDLYCKYYTSYNGMWVADKDQCYRVGIYWRTHIKTGSYHKKNPEDLYYFKGYSQATFGRRKQMMKVRKMRMFHPIKHRIRAQPMCTRTFMNALLP